MWRVFIDMSGSLFHSSSEIKSKRMMDENPNPAKTCAPGRIKSAKKYLILLFIVKINAQELLRRVWHLGYFCIQEYTYQFSNHITPNSCLNVVYGTIYFISSSCRCSSGGSLGLVLNTTYTADIPPRMWWNWYVKMEYLQLCEGRNV